MPLLPEDVRRYAKSLYQRLEDSGATVADGVNVANALDEMVVARAAQTAGRHPEEVSLALSYEEKEKLRESALQELRERIGSLEEVGALDFTTAFQLRATLDGVGTHLLRSLSGAPAAEFSNSSVFLTNGGVHLTKDELEMLLGYAQYALEGLEEDPEHSQGWALYRRLDAGPAALSGAAAQAPVIVIDEAEPSFDPDGIPF